MKAADPFHRAADSHSETRSGQAAGNNLLFHSVIAGSVLAIFLVSLGMLRLTGTTLVWARLWNEVATGAIAYLAGLMLIVCARLFRAPRLRDAGLVLIWTRLLAVVLLLPIFAAGRLALPMRDSTLDAIDRRLLLTVPMVIGWVGRYGWLKILLDRSYASLTLLTVAAVIVPLLMGKMRAAKELLLSSAVAVVITAGIFAVVPAIGPWTIYPLAADPLQSLCERTILTLRHAGPQVLDMTYSGIVSFPSFHAILAVLSAVSLARCSRAAVVPSAIWAGLIIVSTVSTGWHYVVDVWGGLLFSVFCLAAARWFTRMEERIRSE